MKRMYGILTVIILSSLTIYSQDEDQHRNFKMPEGNGHISGIVLDKGNSQPLTGVTIQFFKTMRGDTSKVKGGETDDKGKYVYVVEQDSKQRTVVVKKPVVVGESYNNKIEIKELVVIFKCDKIPYQLCFSSKILTVNFL